MTFPRWISGLFIVSAASISQAAAIYDASTNQLPQAPDWNRFDANTPLVGSTYGYNAPQSVAGGIFSMGPTDQSKYTFYCNSNQTLDHTKTVNIEASLKVVSDGLSTFTNRAGLGIAITDDRNFYNELYIDPTEIFLNKVQNGQRVRDTAFAMNTTAAFHDYLFQLHNDTITIFVDGVQRLQGGIYDLAGVPALPTAKNFASIGDITSDDSGTWQAQGFSVTVLAPEPATTGLLAVAAFAMRRRSI